MVFPCLNSANIAYRMLMSMGMAESVGPVQMGLKKPVHVLDVEASVRDIVNMTVIAVIDAQLNSK
jgi:malate dehydrogenase (oxaloacetate-decarboxylating)(NADP+)